MKISKLLKVKAKHEDPRSIKVKGADCILIVTNCVRAFDYGHIATDLGDLDDPPLHRYRLVALEKGQAHHQVNRYRSGGMAQDVTHVPEMRELAETAEV